MGRKLTKNLRSVQRPYLLIAGSQMFWFVLYIRGMCKKEGHLKRNSETVQCIEARKSSLVGK